MISNYFISLFVLASSHAYILNATGGTFPQQVYNQATFAYQFAQAQDNVIYSALGSTTGKCNIMGYWQTANTNSFLTAAVKNKDTLICTDKCIGSNIAVCGNNSAIFPRFDHLSRRPLVHFSASDSTLKAADYNAFPDLQMFPAVAGAVVPIYNIQDLANISAPVVLSRATITAIFLGNIRQWNDPRILNDNSGRVKTILSGISQSINVVVRTDSSGTTEIFSNALASFDPAGAKIPDYSFATTATAGQTPKWCGQLTDEIQTITITGCISSLTQASLRINLMVVGTNNLLYPVHFNCNDTASNVKIAFETIYGIGDIKVIRTNPTTDSYIFSIGYWGSKLMTKKPS